jgi:uncharacterized repeat protein (TIGR03803 family)
MMARRKYTLGSAVIYGALALPASGFGAVSEAVLFSFPGSGIFPGGATPQAGLVRDAQGNFYGTATAGGAFACNCGVVFMVSPPSSGSGQWTETILHTFQGYPSDGGVPMNNLTFDGAGNLYGTTLLGGSAQAGTVFKLMPPPAGQTQWSESMIYEFSGTDSDGQFPYSNLVFDAAGNLYGTSFLGGSGNLGLAFELVAPTGDASRWNLVALHSFAGGSDGANPISGVTFGAQGNLYGTTFSDGVSGISGGTVFQLAPSGAGYAEAVLHTFSAVDVGKSPDGGLPYGNLLLDSSGDIFGTTLTGGGGQIIPGEASNAGTVFMLTPPSGSGTAWRETLIHSFNGDTGDPSTADGESPYGGLIFDAAGNLYGTTAQGGTNDGGTVFELMPPATGATIWTQTVLHDFGGFPDGLGPYGNLVLDAGILYGVTRNGTAISVNSDQIGTVFGITLSN